jgi:hypothetical protein
MTPDPIDFLSPRLARFASAIEDVDEGEMEDSSSLVLKLVSHGAWGPPDDPGFAETFYGYKTVIANALRDDTYRLGRLADALDRNLQDLPSVRAVLILLVRLTKAVETLNEVPYAEVCEIVAESERQYADRQERLAERFKVMTPRMAERAEAARAKARDMDSIGASAE